MSKLNEGIETRRKKYVTYTEARETWVETHRCTCGKLLVDKLTQSQIEQMWIGNLPCDCGELLRGSLVEATADYEDLGHYDESASENLVLAIKKLFWRVEVNTTPRARIVEEALKLKIDPGLFVFKHHLCGRSGVTSSNWSNPVEYTNEYRSRFKPHFRLKESKFLAGPDYTIADIATWPWMARHEWHDIGLKNYQNLSRWYLEISERDAVIKGYSFMDKEAKIPKL